MGIDVGAGMGMGMGMGMGYQPSFQPMYNGYQQGPAPVQQQPQGMTQKEHADMEAAFEKALEDVRNQEAAETAEPQQSAPEEEIREAKGEFDKVWESLRPEAERLGKLAEWEREFSQVSPL